MSYVDFRLIFKIKYHTKSNLPQYLCQWNFPYHISCQLHLYLMKLFISYVFGVDVVYWLIQIMY